MLTHSQEAADADDNVGDLPRFIEDDLTDVADLFIAFITDVNAHELGSAPFAFLVCGSRSRRVSPGRGLSDRYAAAKGDYYKSRSQIFGNQESFLQFLDAPMKPQW